MQEEGLTNEGRHDLLLLHKQVHDKRSNAESLRAYIARARLTACEMGVFSREISQPPSLWSYLGSSPMGVFLRDYGILSSCWLIASNHVGRGNHYFSSTCPGY